MSSSERREPTWPFLVVLVILFALSATAPRAWRTVERADPPHLRQMPQLAFGGAAHELQTLPTPIPPSHFDPQAESPNNLGRPSAASTASAPSAEDASHGTILFGERPEPLAPATASAQQPSEDEMAANDANAGLVNTSPHHTVADDLSGWPSLAMVPPADDADSMGDQAPAGDGSGHATVEIRSDTGDLGGANELRMIDPGDAAAIHTPPVAQAELGPAPSAPNDRPAEAAEDLRRPSRWVPPQALLDQLQVFASHAIVGDWVAKVRDDIETLGWAFEDDALTEAQTALVRLQHLLDEAASLQNRLADDRDAGEFRQLRYALIRRINVWKLTGAMGGLGRVLGAVCDSGWARLAQRTAAAEEYLQGAEGQTWREFLRTEAVREVVTQRSVLAEEHCRELAEATLRDITSRDLTPDQRRFLDHPALAAYLKELTFWRGDAITAGDLLRCVERYEQTATPADAEAVMRLYYRLSPSTDAAALAVARTLQTLYRNANVRVVVTAALLNRMIPERTPQTLPVSDTILGRPVFGTSLADTTAYFRFIPDPQRARLALMVRGQVTSDTWSQAGPATFFNDGYAEYEARKVIELSPGGILFHPAEIDVRNRVELRQVSTTLDPIPVLGFLAQEVARGQLAERRLAMNAEVKWKLAGRALAEIERESESQFAEMNRKLETDVLSRLSEFSLGPTWIGAQTTEQRLILRWRLGDAWQPGGHTLRPWAAADSLASCQVHESAINNFLAQFRLEGRTFALPNLEAKLRERLRLPQPDAEESTAARADASLTFASENAARVEFRDGRLTVVLAVADLSAPPNHWENFEVRAHYRPEVAEDQIQFVRDGVVQLIGPMDLRSQIALRGVFSKTFSKSRPWRVSAGFLKKHPSLADLTITQLELENGWLGLAIGPRDSNRVAASGASVPPSRQ